MFDLEIPVWVRALAVIGVAIGAVHSLRTARLGPRERKVLAGLTLAVAAIVLVVVLAAARR